MFVKIDLTSDVPIYLQIKNAIIEGIARGELKEGDSLPPIRQLAEDIGVNMHTINKAYNLLKDLGFITINKKYGAVISVEGFNETFMENLKEELRPIIAEAFVKGIDKETFLKLVEGILDEFGGSKNE
ncbi:MULTISPECIES: GntR family transcriptional regulator [Caloramator]|jgi:GntR family transcriptional regulator|uniref:Transcriptional regulator, GntR family n=1 Tax=Caloramator australicus RC3 TaxID=857293 RepID=I7J6I8_9CLOT|nr:MULTISPECIES: GntR family transcriptional regulator [Caloramator]MDO6353804.1 GntR family transcriptional regulator [Caloramator sp. CAR-1]CCJ34539.1 Transcriptional regulator, GntR family [Caloramator australicus RC3]